MDEKQIQFLFDNYAKGKGFKDINEFRSLMGDEGSRKIFFDDSNKELGFKDYNDFEETIGVKKKQSSNNGATPLEATSSNTPNLETEIPLVDIGAARPEDNTLQGNTPGEDDIIGQAQYADELRKRTKTVAGRTMPDEEAAVYAGSVEKGLEAKGYSAKKLAEDFTGIPDYAFNVKGLTKPELLEKYKSNKPQYERNIATAKAQSALRDELYKLPNGRQLWADVVSSYDAAGVGDATQQRENLRRIVSVANTYGGEKSDEIVKNLGIDFSNLYGKESLDVANIEKDPKSAVLNNIQLGAWHLLEDTKPNELNKYKAALLDDKDIKDNPEAKLQKQEAGRQLELLGSTLQKSYAQEKLNPILKEYTALSDKAAKEGLTPIEQQRMVQLEQDGKPFADIIQQVNDNESTLTSRYPMSSYLDANDFAQELVGQKHTGLGWLAAETGKATENTAKGIWDIVSEPFRSDENSNLHQAEILGSSNLSQNSAYLKQENQLQKSFKPELSEELQKDIDAIKNDPSLSDSQKLSKASDLLMSRAGEWRRSPVENGETNIGLTSLMYGVGGLAANLAPFVLGDLVTGGGVNAGALKKFSSMFTSAAATSFHDAYVDALKRGEENPFAHAARVTAINSAALAGADAPAAIRKMIGGETAIGKLVSKMTDDEIAAALKESPKALTAFGKSLDAIKKTGGQIANTSLQSFKSGAKIAGITTAGQAVNDAIDKELKSPIDYAKQAAIETLKFGVGGTMAGIAGRAISKPTEMNLAAISEAGKNPEPFLMSLETMEKNGSISPEQAQQVRTNIEKANKIFKSSPILNNPDITDKVKREYLYNTWAKKDIQESMAELPPKMAEKAEMEAMVLDHKNELLLHPPTDKQLESQQSSLEKKLEPKKDAEGKSIELPEKEKASLEAELEAVKQTIEARQKEVPETKTEEVKSSTTVSSEVKSSGVGGDVETTTNVLNETQKSNPTVWQKIKDAFNNLVSKTKEYLNKAKGTQYEELAKVLGDHLKNVRTSTIEDLKGVLGEKIGGQLQKLHILVNSGKGDLQIFFHEAMHHITFEKINQYLNNNHENLKPHEIDAIQNLQRIFTDSKAKIEAMKVKTSFHYGFTNLHEFISEAFSNPEFQRLLKELPSEGKHPTVFKAFLDAIAKLMGLKDATILNDIFHHTEKLLDKPKSENEGIAELYHQAKAEGTHSDFVKAVEQSIPTQEVKGENKPIQNEPIKEVKSSTTVSGGEAGSVGVGGDVKELNSLGADIAFDKPQRKDYGDGEKGDLEYANANIEHNKKVDEIIGGLTQEGTLRDNQGGEYLVTITSQGVRVVNKMPDGTEGSDISYRKGKRITANTPFTNGFSFKPKEQSIPTQEVKGENKPIQNEPIKEALSTTVSSGVKGGLNGVESFETSKGSKYVVGEDGKTSRFKTATNEQKQPQDLTVFAKFEGQKADDYLEALHGYNGQSVHVLGMIDGKVKPIETNEDAAKATHIKLTIVDKDGKITDKIEASTEPIKGYSVFDQRKVSENKYEKHIGNEISKINYKENKPIQNEPIKEGAESTQPITTETKVNAEASPVESGSESGKEPPKESTGIVSEPKRTVFSHRGLQEVATEFGLDDIRSRDKVSDLQLFKSADETINKWAEEGSYKKNIDDLVVKAKAGEIFSPEQNVIMAQHIAQMREQAKQAREKFGINSPEYNEQLKQLQDITTIGQKVRSDIGAALRVPTFSRTYMPTLEDAMTAKMEANGTDALTEKQKAEVEKEFDKIKKSRDEAEKNWKDAEARFTEMQAQNELLKQQTASKGKSKSSSTSKTGNRDYKAERKSYKDELKSLVEEYKAAGQKMGITSDGGAESFIITTKMARAIMKIVGSHLEETGAKLADVTKKTFDDIKDLFDGITEADVHDVIAGKYTDKKTRSELSIQLNDIRTEAKLLDEYNRLLNKEPKSEKEKQAKNARLTELRKNIKELQKEQGEGQYSDKQKAERAIAANNKREQEIRDKIAKGDFEPKPKPKSFIESKEFKAQYPELYKKALDSYNAKQDAQHDFDVALLRDSQAKRYQIVPGKNKLGTILSAGRAGKNRVVDFAGAAANTTKKLVTGVDDSSLFMQTLAAMTARPVVAAKALKLHALDALSQKRFDRNLAELHNSPDWDLMQKSGLDVTEPKSLSQLNREEAFSGKTLDLSVKFKGEKHKVLETLLAPFERAFTSLGNGMRVIAFRTLAEKYMSEGKTFENDPKLYKDLALMLNTETGRGKQNEYIQKASELVTKGIWSPRLMASRLNMLGISDAASIFLHKAGTKGYYSQLHPEIRKEALKSLVAFSSTVLTLSYLAAWKFGGTVDNDPRSQTFLDIKMPNGKSYNISGGFSQYIRVVAQSVSGGISKNGVYQPFNGQKEAGSNLLHFMRGKVTPVAGVGTDLLTGKDFAGQPVTLGGEAAKLTLPLSLQGVVNDVKKDGLSALYNATLPSFVGITVKDERDYTSHKFSPEATKLLQDNQIPIKMPDKKYIKDGKEVDMTDDEYKKYLTRVDERIDHDLKQLKENGVVEGGNIPDAIKEIVSDANRTAKEELFGFQIKEQKMPSFIRGGRPMPFEKKND